VLLELPLSSASRLTIRSCERVRIVAAAVASYSALPEPMLARSGRLPTSGDYAHEVKWDGFRELARPRRPGRLVNCVR
jgi:ATP-dependent DNA ligase